MRTVTYEIFEGPQTITVIPPGTQPQRSPERGYTRLISENPSQRTRTYTVQSPEDLPPTIKRYLYQEPYPSQAETTEKKYTFRTESPGRGRTEERSIKVVSSSESPARASSPHPKGILRLRAGGSAGEDTEIKESKSSTKIAASTASVVGTTTALVTSTKSVSRSSSASSSPASVSSFESASSASSVDSGTHVRSDFSSYARTSSRKGTFHFAYSTHLSPAQLRSQVYHKASSSKPIALARLQNFTWYINARGNANIASCPPSEHRPAETDADIVWGLLYNIDPDDEIELDAFHGWERITSGGLNNAIHEVKGRPWQQGDCLTNKLFLLVEAVEWFVSPGHFGLPGGTWDGDKVRAMVYADEKTVKPGRIRNEYITRMSDAAASGIEYGIPRAWFESVMRMYGIEPRRMKETKTTKTTTTKTHIRRYNDDDEEKRSTTKGRKGEIIDVEEIVEEEEEREEVKENHRGRKESRGRSRAKEEKKQKVDEKVTVIRKKVSSEFY